MAVRELDGRTETYVEFAAEYYETTIARSDVEHVFAHRPLSNELITQINPDADADTARAAARTLGYPG